MVKFDRLFSNFLIIFYLKNFFKIIFFLHLIDNKIEILAKVDIGGGWSGDNWQKLILKGCLSCSLVVRLDGCYFVLIHSKLNQ